MFVFNVFENKKIILVSLSGFLDAVTKDVTECLGTTKYTIFVVFKLKMCSAKSMNNTGLCLSIIV